MSTESKKIKITVVEAKLNPDREIVSRQNIYCLLTLREKFHKTLINHDCGNIPVWLETFTEEMGEDNNLKIEVFNERNTISDILIGKGSVDISTLGDKDSWVKIYSQDECMGEVLIECIPAAQASKFAEDKKSYFGQISKHDIEGFQSKQNVKESKQVTMSLKDFMEHPICKEAPANKETKLAGTKNSEGASKPKFEEKQASPISLKDLLDKAELKEATLEDVTKITGTKNLRNSEVEHKDSKWESHKTEQIVDKQDSKLGKVKNEFVEKTAQQDIAKMLEKESFQKATHQDGAKIGGLKNC